jgi:putative phosphoribosyl transferase
MRRVPDPAAAGRCTTMSNRARHTPEDAVEIPSDGVTLGGKLEIPDGAPGIVVFAHGSGSSRFSRRNNAVAAYLREGKLGTLLFDLLTDEEERRDAVTSELRFDIPLLARRLAGAVDWLARRQSAGRQPVGLFGASTGAAAALIVAAEMAEYVAAVVSRGGRADLAGDSLARVRAPTLLIVGGFDHEVLRLNRDARERLRCQAHLAVVDGATHLFEEPGALERVAELARRWFLDYMPADSRREDT